MRASSTATIVVGEWVSVDALVADWPNGVYGDAWVFFTRGGSDSITPEEVRWIRRMIDNETT